MKILVIDDEKSIRQATALTIQAEGHEAATADNGASALLRLQEDHFDLVFLDLRLGEEDGIAVLERIGLECPGLPVVVFTAYATVETAVRAIQRGAYDYLEKPFSPGQLRHLLLRVAETQRLQRRIRELENEVAESAPECDFDSEDSGLRDAYQVLFRAAGSSAAILLHGEPGTGKGGLAREIHRRSPLQSRPFIAFNCAGIEPGLADSVLFGRARGGIPDIPGEAWGRVAAAHGGTLFLEEVADLPLETQPRILRLLEERQYERVGETRPRPADVRIIAATSRDLQIAVREGRFREDLLHRLNVISIEMPPLRRRPQDIPRLARRFLAFFARKLSRPVDAFTTEALHRLQRHAWPGNIRELRNAVERSVLLARGSRVDVDDLPLEVRQSIPPEIRPGAMVTLDELEQLHIRKVLDSCESMEMAARVLGIDPATLYRKRKRMNLA